MSELQEKIAAVVQATELEAPLKAVLGEVLGELTAYDEQVMQAIRDKCIPEPQTGTDCNDGWRIVTALVNNADAAEMAAKNFTVINAGCSIVGLLDNSSNELDELFTEDENVADSEQFFLNCTYSDMANYFDRTYEGLAYKSDGLTERFEFSLEFNPRLVEQEALLAKAALQYGIERPVIFSPFARKSVLIRINGSLSEEGRNDYRLAENGLAEVLMTDKRLMWNVKLENDDTLPTVSEAPYDKQGNYEYVYEDIPDNVYIIIDEPYLTLERKGNSINIVTRERLVQTNFHKVTIYSDCVLTENMGAEYFENEFLAGILKKARLRSISDINYVLNGMHCGAYSGEYCSAKQAGKVVKIYNHDAQYMQEDEQRFFNRCWRKPEFYLKFTGSNDCIVEDYANYVLAWLNKNYPELTWAGVR